MSLLIHYFLRIFDSSVFLSSLIFLIDSLNSSSISVSLTLKFFSFCFSITFINDSDAFKRSLYFFLLNSTVSARLFDILLRSSFVDLIFCSSSFFLLNKTCKVSYFSSKLLFSAIISSFSLIIFSLTSLKPSAFPTNYSVALFARLSRDLYSSFSLLNKPCKKWYFSSRLSFLFSDNFNSFSNFLFFSFLLFNNLLK